MRARIVYTAGMLLSLVLTGGCAPKAQPATKPVAPPPTGTQQTASVVRAVTTTRPAKLAARGDLHIHLPGIGGYRGIDRRLLRGLAEGHLGGTITHYDWTARDPGFGALLARKRNDDEATIVSQIIVDHARANPGSRITLTAHSGGAGILAWALERLPDDVTVDTVVFLSPALSPAYDLSKALMHVRNHAYAFYSPHDVAVLGIGTTLFGTIDGVKAEASGKVGFTKPATADAAQYDKLLQFPYEKSWAKLSNIGDHVGSMARPFIREIVTPLLLSGKLPPSTQPAERPASASAAN